MTCTMPCVLSVCKSTDHETWQVCQSSFSIFMKLVLGFAGNQTACKRHMNTDETSWVAHWCKRSSRQVFSNWLARASIWLALHWMMRMCNKCIGPNCIDIFWGQVAVQSLMGITFVGSSYWNMEGKGWFLNALVSGHAVPLFARTLQVP